MKVVHQSRQLKRGFERERDKEMAVLLDWVKKFLHAVHLMPVKKKKRQLYKRFCKDWNQYTEDVNRTNEKINLDKNMFRQYMERFYMLCGASDAPQVWKKHRKVLEEALPVYRKFLIWITDGKIIAMKKIVNGV